MKPTLQQPMGPFQGSFESRRAREAAFTLRKIGENIMNIENFHFESIVRTLRLLCREFRRQSVQWSIVVRYYYSPLERVGEWLYLCNAKLEFHFPYFVSHDALAWQESFQ